MYNKAYTYKIYDKDGNYLGTWNDVITDPNWTHTINSPGVIFDVDLARTDNYGEDTNCAVGNQIKIYVNYGENANWITHVPDDIVDEDGEQLIFADGAPNGRLIFDGLITRVIPKFGADLVTATISSRGIELDNNVIEEASYSLENLTQVSYQSFGNQGSPFNTNGMAQVFTAPTTDDLISIITIIVADGSVTNTYPMTVTLKLYIGDDPATEAIPANLLGTATIVANSSLQLLSKGLSTGFRFDEPIPLTIGTEYMFTIEPDAQNAFPGSDKYPLKIGTNTGLYSGGELWYSYNDGGEVWGTTATDASFNLLSASGDTEVEYTDDNLADIMKAVLAINASQGGVIFYSDVLETIENPFVNTDMTFNTNTVLEAINKVLEQAPSDWYWYVDLGTNLLYFKEMESEPEIYLTKGVEIENLELEETLEEVINVVYFTGGETAPDVNLFIKRINSTSLAEWGRFSERVTDNRVTSIASAELIAESILERHANPRFKTRLVLNASKIDIENIDVGQVVGFRNFGNYIDDLQLQIVSLSYTPDQLTISLDSQLPKISRTVDTLKRQLKQQETQNNPTAPS